MEKGAAAQVMMGDRGEGLTYRRLREELQKCFGLEGHTGQFRNQLKMKRRQKGESLRTLYQDVSHLLLLAFPGPQSELRDHLSVEAFIDSLNDYELKRSVKDRFPKTLAGAFQIALDLEANRKSLHVGDERRDKGKHYRTDMEARAVSQDVDWKDRVGTKEPEWKEALGMIQKNLTESQAEVRRIVQQKEEGKWKELEAKVKEMELRDKSRDQGQKFPPGWAPGWDNRTSPNQEQYRAAQAVPFTAPPSQTMNPANPWPPQDDRNASYPSQLRGHCFTCGSPEHFAPNCPQRTTASAVVCGNCNQQGHQRKECRNSSVCWTCGRPGHRKADCKSRREVDTRIFSNGNGNGDARTNMITANEVQEDHTRDVYLEMTCKGVPRKFLLDSGCDLTMVPTSYVKGMFLFPTPHRVRAANGTEIELKGKVSVTLGLGDLKIHTVALVSDHIAEGLIGNDWLAKNEVYWGFHLGVINLRGKNFALTKRTGDAVACRVVAQKRVIIPPFSETIIPSKLLFQRAGARIPDQGSCNAVMEPSELAQGVYVASAVLPARCGNIPTRVINSSARSFRLESDEVLGEAQPGEVMNSETTSTPVAGDWLEKLVSSVDTSVAGEEKDRFREILRRYSDCFSLHEYDLGRTSVVTHRIDTGDSRPVKQVLRRQPLVHQEEIERQVKGMLEQDVIEPSKSPWASNVVIVKKKDGALRFCIDYRQLNDVTVKDSYPLPRIVDCLDALSGGKYFSAFDLRSGYFQVSMDERDKEKTSFVTRSGLFQFKVLPFGVTNGPATFQRLMDLTMVGLNYNILLVYLDDIILMSRTVSEHLDRLVMMLDRLRSAGLKLKPSKCNLLQKTIHFLGHVVSDNGISTDPEKVEAVQDWLVPCNVTEVRGFIGLCSYYRRFVKNFAEIADPLHALTGKRASFHWDDRCQDAFEELKIRLTTTPILAMPRDDGEYRLDTDASGEAIGAVLSQVQDGEEKVVAFASRLLSHSERNYCVTRRELLAVVYFIKHFRAYLLGHHFLLRTDHAALKWLRSMPEPVGQQARWLEQMEEYTFDIEHRPGKKHANADAMSRRPCRQCTVDQETAVGSYMCNRVVESGPGDGTDEYLDPAQMKEDYASDPKLATFHALFSASESQVPWDEVVGLDRDTKGMWLQWDRLCIVDGVLYRRWVTVDGLQKRWQLVPPKSVQPRLLKLAHTGMTGGHLVIKRTQHQIQLRAYWPGWYEDTARYCRMCTECAAYHRGAPTKQDPLQIFPVGEPFERVAIDLTGPHPPSRSGHKFILTVIDLFSKWAEAIPIRNKEAVTVARALMDVFVSRFGVPLQLMTDNGREFCNSVLSELCRLLGVDRVRTTAYKASTNGAVERFHRTLNSMIGKVVAINQRNWDELLPSIMAAYRASRHEATGFSPNFLIFGR